MTNQLLSNERSCTPVLQYLFANTLPYQDILYVMIKQKITYTLLYKHNVYLDQPECAYGFSNFSLILPVQYS